MDLPAQSTTLESSTPQVLLLRKEKEKEKEKKKEKKKMMMDLPAESTPLESFAPQVKRAPKAPLVHLVKGHRPGSGEAPDLGIVCACA